jgi:hypothetical protein
MTPNAERDAVDVMRRVDGSSGYLRDAEIVFGLCEDNWVSLEVLTVGLGADEPAPARRRSSW